MGLSKQVGCHDHAVIGRYNRVIGRYIPLIGCYIHGLERYKITLGWRRAISAMAACHTTCADITPLRKQEKVLYSASAELADRARAGPERRTTKLPRRAVRLTG